MSNYKYCIFLAIILYSQNAYSASENSFFLNVKISKKIQKILAQKHQSVVAHIIYKTSPNNNAHSATGQDGYIKLGEEVKIISPNKEQQIFVSPSWQNQELFVEPIVFSREESQTSKPTNLLTCPVKTYRMAQKRIVVKCFL
ncbi:hypothetical protein [Bartonella sp. TP]|uniref:hypothetical protein n=1 Tax=Bartonella sp. TP TaxID=3057550 RepID=UPI0025B1D99B|nr:hypothetical protein [Bartonella sp. TP]MDN5248790.1 hypothetical protein [Alphaproteobacteria bacterium]WJW80054.1 hypothetical protein QVL57_00345 [Bartonella sp. TP]